MNRAASVETGIKTDAATAMAREADSEWITTDLAAKILDRRDYVDFAFSDNLIAGREGAATWHFQNRKHESLKHGSNLLNRHSWNHWFVHLEHHESRKPCVGIGQR